MTTSSRPNRCAAPAPDWSADLDGNGITNVIDLGIFAADYLASGLYLASDLNDDSTVDFRDFAIFAKQWRNKAPWYQVN